MYFQFGPIIKKLWETTVPQLFILKENSGLTRFIFEDMA